MALRFVPVAVLVLNPIWPDCPHTGASRTLPQEEEQRVEEEQKAQAPPESILKNLRANFEKVECNMCKDEVFRTLGLAEYQKYLEDNSKFVMDGAGGNWRYYIDDQNGYSFALRSFLDAYTECMIQLPGETYRGGFGKRWRTKRVDAKPIKPTRVEQNSILPKKT